MNETSICKYFKTCGNCQFLDKEYSETLKFKRDLVYKNFHNNGFDININNIIQAEENFHYRNKMIISYKFQHGKLISGFYQENSHQVVDISFCVMHSSIQNEILKQLKKIFDDLKIRAYDEDTKRGLLRYVLLREAFFTKEILITIVTSSDIFPSRSEVIKRIRDISPRIKTIIQNINPRKTSIVLGEKEKILFGQGFIIDKLGDFSFRITSKSFYQVNPLQTLKLYSQIRELASFQGYETIIDAYSGVGTIGMFLSNDVREVVCVENNKQAVSAAILNAKINQIKNITFICVDATHYLKKLSQTSARIDAIIMDPPRSGSTVEFLKAIIHFKPSKIIYVSCNPETLVRDLKELKTAYQISNVVCVDMFCWTNHVETLVVLSKKSASHIVVDVEFGEGEGQISLKEAKKNAEEQKPKKKTTYKDIQRYVEENYGFKVHTAYIAEVKRELGLPMYDAPNAVEELKRPRSHPTKQMTVAIKAALKHFEII